MLTRRTTLGLLATTGLAAPHLATAQARTRLEAIHWWITAFEQAALRELVGRVEQRSVEWVDIAVPGQDAAKTQAVTRVLGGQPPGLMMWHVSTDLGDLMRDGVIRDLDGVAGPQGWDAAVPESLRRILKVDGKYSAVPMNVHGYSWLFSNRRVLANAGVGEVPRNWPGLLAALERLRSAGTIPVALGGAPWQEAAVFAMVTLATQGPEFWDQAFVRHDPRTDPARMQAALEEWYKVKAFTDRVPPGRSWADAANMIATGRAGVFFHGDWAKGELNNAGLRLGQDYDITLMPGTAGAMMIVTDAFCLPNHRDRAVREAQDTFARIAMDRDAQHAFILKRGGFPARADVPKDGFDANGLEGMALLQGGARLTMHFAMGMKADMRTAVYDVLTKFWNAEGRPNTATAARDLRNAIDRNRRA